jgi:hypothetical protein
MVPFLMVMIGGGIVVGLMLFPLIQLQQEVQQFQGAFGESDCSPPLTHASILRSLFTGIMWGGVVICLLSALMMVVSPMVIKL